MRFEPENVGGITMESGTELVINSAAAHGLASILHHLQEVSLAGSPVSVQEKKEAVGHNEFWFRAETAMGGIIFLAQIRDGKS
jgi:hypothetical protein